MEKLYQPGMHYSPGQSHTLYAKWEADRYLLRIDPADGNILEDQIKDFVKKKPDMKGYQTMKRRLTFRYRSKQGMCLKDGGQRKACF